MSQGSEGYKVLVCGGREYTGYQKMSEILDEIVDGVWHESEQTEVTIIQGGAKGADFLAKVWATDYWNPPLVNHEEYPADWKKYGKAAGFIRNQQMLDEGKPDLVVAFPGGRGTADMVRRAKKAGIKVIEVENENSGS